MATSMRSYGLIDADSRCLFMINAQPGEHLHPDQLIGVNLSPIQALKIEEGDEDLWCLLIDHEPAYSTFWMEVTMNRGSIATARFVDGSQEFDDEETMEIAEIVVEYDKYSRYLRKISELPVTIIGKNKADGSKEGEGEICVVCQEEYEAGLTIGTLKCGHVYHEKCIKKWLVQKNLCPICSLEPRQQQEQDDDDDDDETEEIVAAEEDED
uniref:RING-type E3 ubiquitin transferase n=1 Tax=Lactuca sativa TaxID=4236 RepID=A0A9R1XTX0_LACSA|nr:hypothetical protein LSAT_V11C300129200 [Lactuca sativa]